MLFASHTHNNAKTTTTIFGQSLSIYIIIKTNTMNQFIGCKPIGSQDEEYVFSSNLLLSLGIKVRYAIIKTT